MTAPRILAFVTESPEWWSRWTDEGMTPWHLPVFAANAGRMGFLVGPYLSERSEIRGNPLAGGVLVVRYETWERAARELNLLERDFVPAADWLARSYPELDAKEILGEADQALRVGHRPAYEAAIRKAIEQMLAVRRQRIEAGEATRPMTGVAHGEGAPPAIDRGGGGSQAPCGAGARGTEADDALTRGAVSR